MAKAGSIKNYKSGPKNNWRRTVWNEVLRRTNGREQEQPILYLAGPQDLDREIAVEKGVPTQNMIAIDFSTQNVGAVRDKGLPALKGDVADVLGSWPESRPVCAVMLDFCCGLTMQAVDVFELFERRPLRDSVVMVNLMRGRDQWSNRIREWCGGDGTTNFLPWMACYAYGPLGPPGADCLSDKHRGLQFIAFHAIDWVRVGSSAAFVDEIDIPTCADAFKRLRPHFFSYKSGALSFDSVIFEHYARGLDLPAEAEREVLANRRSNYNPDVARRISATLAVRTARMRAS